MTAQQHADDSALGLVARLRRRWRERDPVTICVPAYRAADVIRETLESIATQTYRNLRVIISVDPSDDGTDEVCRTFLDDPRFQLILQPVRLGWPGNVNYLLDQVRTKYYCIIFHDDLIDPNYVACLIRCLRGSPSYLCAYPLLEHFGNKPARTVLASLTGDRFARALGFFSQPRNSVPIRGLMRSAALRQGLRLRKLGTAGFAAEWLYTFELALMGRSKRVGRTRYYSRYRPTSASNDWRTWSADRKRAAWREMLRELHAAVKRQDFTEQQQQALFDAALTWAYQLRSWLPADDPERAMIADPAKRAALAEGWRDDPLGNPPFL